MYDSDTGKVTSALQSSSTAVFTDSTISKILALSTSSDSVIKIDNSPTIGANGNVIFAADTEVGFVNVLGTDQALNITGSTSVLILGGSGSVNLTVGNPNDTVVSGSVVAEPQPILVGGDNGAVPVNGGSDSAQSINVQGGANADAQRVIVTTAQADKITIVDAKNTYVVANHGDTIVAGHGYDTVVAAEGDSTIQGGDHTIVQLAGHDGDYTVVVNNGHAVISHASNGMAIDVSQVRYVQLDNNDALILAANEKEAAVAHLFEVILGRDADFAGLEYWFAQASSGTSLVEIADGFLSSAEYTDSSLSDAAFISSLYTHAFGRAGDVNGTAFWLDAIEHGATRAEIAAAFADAAANTANGEATVVGSITIVDGYI